MVGKILLCALVLFAHQIQGEGAGHNPDSDWWTNSVIYQIYPRSFKDSNDDGVGDLKGIEQQLDYFKDLGIEVLWLSPIYKSPMNDMGYDISDFKAIDPIFGTMDDFDSLLKNMKTKNMKLLLDLVPNHSSDECEWFKKSVKNDTRYRDYYVWKNPKNWIKSTNDSVPVPVPPNNWISVFQGSAWEYHPERKQFYLHEFATKQPDLNFRSPAVVDEIMNVLTFWLDKGVDGFRIDSIMYMYENATFADEPVISNDSINGNRAYNSLNHTQTMNQAETYELARKFRQHLDPYSKKDGSTRLILSEAYTTLSNVMKYYGTAADPIAHVPFNFHLLTNLNFSSNAEAFKKEIMAWMDAMPKGMTPNWVMGNHDNPRMTSRFDPHMVDGLNMLILLLPGVTIAYQGDELGMKDMKIRYDQTTDVMAKNVGPALYDRVTRDPERTPMQWNSSLHAGFSKYNGKTWLPVNPDYYELNVDAQKRADRSHYNVFKKLLKLKQNNVVRTGDYKVTPVSEWVLTLTRSLPGEEMYIVVLNLNNDEAYVTLNESISRMNVFIASVNSEYNEDDKVDTGDVGFKMRPNSALVLQAVLRRQVPEKYKSSGNLSLISVILFVTVIVETLIKYL